MTWKIVPPRSVVPVLPPISTAAGSPSRHTPTLTTHKTKPHFEQNSQSSLRAVPLHSEDQEQWASGKELVVKVTELTAELGRMKAVIGHLEAERTSQDVWLKERWGFTSSTSFNLQYQKDNVPNVYNQKIFGRELNLAVWWLHKLQISKISHVCTLYYILLIVCIFNF